MVRSRMRGRWARDWDHCQECGTTEVRHFARGLCCKCYYRVWQSNHPYEPKKVKPIPAYRTKEWLHQRYEVENLSVVQCAELAGVETYVISHWLHRNNITVCRGKAHRGKIIRPETRRKMSLRMKGQNNHQFGKKGPACPNWKGGVSHEPYPFGFNDALKKTIRERDGKCVICGSTSGRLAVHHIDYNKANIAQSNLVALCPNCHSKTNGNRSVWQDRLSEYIKELAQC